MRTGPPAADDETAGPGPSVAVEAQRRLRPEQVARALANLTFDLAMSCRAVHDGALPHLVRHSIACNRIR